MPRLQIVVNSSDLSSSDGSVTMVINRAIHTKKVVLKAYSIHARDEVTNANDWLVNVMFPWMTSGYYNTDNSVFTAPTHGIKLPVANNVAVSPDRGTMQMDLDWEFHVPSNFIPSSFPVRFTDATGKRWGTDSALVDFNIMLYFEFEERIEGL